jgi:hypothetical protein
MPRNKTSACVVTALIILFSFLNLNTTFAQQIASLEVVFPNTGSIGESVNLLLFGDGFDHLGDLAIVRIGSQELPIRNSRFVSNQLIEAVIFIPEQTPVGATEIRFIFDDKTVMDAYFIVTEPGDKEISPVINRIYPQEGQVDTEMELFCEGDRLFELERLGGVIIGGMAIPVTPENATIESEQSIVISIYLPPETPIGDTEISLYFDNYSYRDYFFVSGRETDREEPRGPILWNLYPTDGEAGTNIELFLEGENLNELGDLIGVIIGRFKISEWDYDIESDESLVIYAYLPEDTPGGGQTITILFENAERTWDFFVSEPPEPTEPDFPTTTVIIIGTVVIVGALLVRRGFRRRRARREKQEERSTKPRASIRFNVEVDIGTQSVELTDPDQTRKSR